MHALQRLDPFPDEIIVVADGADPDDLRRADVPGIRTLSHEQTRGPAFARNRGAEAATSDVLFFVDADCELAPDTIGRVQTHMSTCDVMIGSYDAAPAAPETVSQFRNLLHHYTHQHAQSNASTFWGACGAVRRTLFLDVGGFEETYERPCVEDIELGYRLHASGARMRLDPDLHVTHLKRWTLKSMILTDIFARARPWTRLLLARRSSAGVFPDDLNTRTSEKLSVAATGMGAVGLALSPMSWTGLLVAAAAAVGVAVLNASFYRFLAQQRSAAFAARAFPLHLLYFGSAGSGFALGVFDHLRAPGGSSDSLTFPAVAANDV